MPTIKLGSLSKRKNSTYVPTSAELAGFTEYTVTFKKPTSIRNPVFELATDARSFNYAYIADFNRYYFVENTISIHNGLTEYHLVEDVMASQKTAIGQTMARIAFASSGYDKWIPDSRLGVYSSINVFTQSVASGINNGANVLTVANNQDGIAHYAMNDTNVGNLVSCLMSTDVGDKVRKMMNDPMQSILSCVWVPYVPSDLASVNVRVADELLNGNYGNPVVLGGWISPSNKIHQLSTVTLTIPFAYQDFRDMTPYTKMSIYLPGIGNVDLNPNDYIGNTSVNVIPTVDITTGDIIYRIFNDSMELMQTISFCGGVPVPISGTSSNMRGAIASVGGIVAAGAGIAASIASGGSAAPAAGALIMSGASAALNANMNSTSFKGSNGSRVDFKDYMITLTVTVRDTEDPTDAGYIATKGRPVCKSALLSGYSGGFVQCDDASVIGAMESWERETINGYLNSGFFYE